MFGGSGLVCLVWQGWVLVFFFFKQKTAYEMRISDWSSDVCSSDLSAVGHAHIDSAWLWPLRETRRKVARTVSNVATLAQEYPELVFAFSQAQQHAWEIGRASCRERVCQYV